MLGFGHKSAKSAVIIENQNKEQILKLWDAFKVIADNNNSMVRQLQTFGKSLQMNIDAGKIHNTAIGELQGQFQEISMLVKALQENLAEISVGRDKGKKEEYVQ